MNTRTLLASITGLLAVSAGLSSAHATLIALEQFDYSTGSLNTQNGGTGWSGAWGGSGTSQVVTSPGLSYAGMLSAGNASSDNSGSNMQSTRPFDASILGSSGNALSSGTIWYSFLFNTTSLAGNSGVNRVRLFGQNDGADSVGSGVVITANGTNATGTLRSVIRNNQNIVGDEVTYNIGETYFVVVRIVGSTANNSDTVSLWLNPLLTATEGTLGVAASTAIANVQLTGPGTNGGSFQIRGDSNYRGVVDEIRIGSTLDSVLAPIPEPSSAGLMLGAAGLMVGLLRRRRRA